MKDARRRPLWLSALLVPLIAMPTTAQEREQETEPRPARVQKVQAASVELSDGIRLPQEVGELVDPDLPMEAVSETNLPRSLARNTQLDAMIIAISDAGVSPVLVFEPSAVPRVMQAPSSPVAMRPARTTPKPRVGGVQTARASGQSTEGKDTGGQGRGVGRVGVVPDPVESLDLPAGMPAIHWPRFMDGSCTGMLPGEGLYEAKKSWALAHHHVWRAYQLLEFINASASQFRDDFWEDGYRSADGDENWSPRAWFGPYASYRAGAIGEVVDKLWDRFRTGEFNGVQIKVKCPTPQNEPNNKGNICFTWEPPAHHVVKGYVNLCESFFESDEEYRALIIAHEMLHHATVTWKEGQIWKSYFLGDTHLHADGNTCATGLKTEKMYGTDKTMHLANKSECWHRNIAMRNNDNYAWFIMRLGSAVRDGHLISFPTEGTPWQTPGSTGNECSEIDVPPPGGEWQDPDDCVKIGQELVCPGGGGGGSGMVVPSTCLALPGNLNP